MKQPKEIARQAAKPKRGTHFIVVESGVDVWLQIIRTDGKYLCCLQETRLDTDAFEAYAPGEMKQANMIRTGLTNIPKAKTPEQKEVKDSRNVFFKEMGYLVPANCMECGQPLFAYTDWARRCVTAHIFSKEHFTSISTNPDNIVFLGAALLCKCGCHGDFDNKDAEHRKQMKIYPILLERFEKLKPLMNIQELRRAYTFLGITFQ